jgi:GTP-binding protein Era
VAPENADSGTPAGTGETHCGFVALLGAPNVGKSTLLNRLVGAKISIVTPKVQTTRNRILGIFLDGGAQVVLVDTPGIFLPRRRLDRAMVEAAWSGARDADVIVLLIDAGRGIEGDTRRIFDGLREARVPVVAAINKVDTVRRDSLLALAAELDAESLFAEIFMISALTGDGVDALRAHLAGAMPPGPWLYPEDQMADMPMRLLAAEVTREQVYLQLHQELPYAAAVETERWTERPDGSVRIDQIVYVQRASQRKIVLGRNGARIKSIGSGARRELEAMLARRVHLFLHVKVRERWADDPEHYRVLGLDYNA